MSYTKPSNLGYTPTNWINDNTAITAERLNNIEIYNDTSRGVINQLIENADVNNSAITALESGTVASNTDDITTINSTLNKMVVLHVATFSGGTTSVLLSNIFTDITHTDYNWIVDIRQNGLDTQNGAVVTLEAYVDVDGNTVRLSSLNGATSVEALYTITGYKKLVSTVY